MANICKSTLTIIGLTEAPEKFAKAASKIMFGIDLDDMDRKSGARTRISTGRLGTAAWSRSTGKREFMRPGTAFFIPRILITGSESKRHATT